MNSPDASADNYLNDQPWNFGYRFRLSPHYLNLTLAAAGYAPIKIGHYCELAFGHGVSLVIHAAANPGIRFVGTDFNPLHADFARRLAGADLENLSLSGLPFSQFFTSTHDRPYDVLAMFGTWSWVPEAEQMRILNFVRQNLRPGGIFGHDNMVMPGNAAVTALRQMLTSFATLDPPADPGNPERALSAVRRAIELMDTNPQFVHCYAGGRDTLVSLLKVAPHHLTHEYFNHNWTTRHFVETARMMQDAGLSFMSSWSLFQACLNLQFTARQSRFLSTIQSPELREQVKDYIQCRSVRYDLWSRGRPVADRSQALQSLDKIRVMAVKPLKDFDWMAPGSAANFELDRASYGPLIERLAEGEAVSIGALRKMCGTSLSHENLLTLIAVLTDGNWVQPVQPDPSSVDAATPACQAVNARILALQAGGKPVSVLASPVTGSGVELPDHHFAFLRARRGGASSPSEYATYAASEHQNTQSSGHSLAQRTPEYFLASAREFEEHALPHYQKLRID